MAITEAFVYQALLMNVVWHREITTLILSFPMDIKFQLKWEIERHEMRGLTDIDYNARYNAKAEPI